MDEISKGVEIRAEIDNQQIRALLLINGGGAIALLSILPDILGSSFSFLARPILVGVIFLMIGLVLAVVSNQLRRMCSLHYETYWKQNREPPNCKVLGTELSDPCICFTGKTCMWLSVAAFFCAGSYVAWCGLNGLPT